MEERAFHPLDYVSVLRRRRWWLIVPIVVSVAIGGALALLLPREYLSQATIGVVAPTLSPELLRGVGSLDKQERQRAISQQLLSPMVLQRVVREEKINPGQPVDEVAGWLRANIEGNIAVPAPIGKGSDKGLDMIVLGYTDSDPHRAQRITNRLAYVFVEENSKTQIERSESTSEVLGQQVQASRDRLTDLEARLREKQQQYMGRLPDQVNANVQMVNGLRQQFDSLSTQLRGEQDRLSVIESQLAQMAGDGSGAESMTASGLAAVQITQRRINDLQQELLRDRALGYTDKHPDIVRLESEIKQARADLAAARQQAPGSGDELLKADPIYRQRLADRDAARLRIRDLQRDSARVQSQIAQYQSRVDSAPVVAQELASLTREYELEKTRYGDLNGKHQQALTAEEVTRKQGGERFSVLYPASLPTTPVKPNIPMILALAVAAGLVLGAAAALAREFLDRSVHDVRALSEFDMPVLGEIPRISA
jgi:polysaccharide chain length determinant protein (PEP-CTERM system associated)